MNTTDIRALIRTKGDLNVQDKNGMTPLMIAVDNQDHELAGQLISAGAKLDLTDKYGQTALMLAAGRNLLPIVRLLIEKKANLRIVSKSGLTAWGFAAENGQRECEEFLRKAGAK